MKAWRKFFGHLKQLSSLPRVKIVVSSRPEFELQEFLRSVLQLRLQDLTNQDIRKYASDILQSTATQGRIGTASHYQIPKLVDTVVRKVEGVFLWVYYALKSLRSGLIKWDNWDELERLNECPNRIEDLYRQMWSRVIEDKQIYREDAAGYFRFATRNRFGTFPQHRPRERRTVFELMVASNCSIQERILEQRETVPLDELIDCCHKQQAQLAFRCAGLLEISEPKSDSDGATYYSKCAERPPGIQVWYVSYETYKSTTEKSSEFNELRSYNSSAINFIHRSALDFLTGTEEGKDILIPSTPVSEERSIIELYISMISMLIWMGEPLDADWIMEELKNYSCLYLLPGSIKAVTHAIHMFNTSFQRMLVTDGAYSASESLLDG